MSARGLTFDTSPQDRRNQSHDTEEVRTDPVDHFDVAARLEASGFGDAAAVVEGSVDVFTYAQAEARADAEAALQAPARARERRPETMAGHDWSAAWVRTVLLVAGAVTFSVGTGSSVAIGGSTLLIAALAGWISGQCCGAPVWRRVGLGDRQGAIQVGTWFVGLVVAVLAVGIVAAAMGQTSGGERLYGTIIVAVWTLYAVLVSVVGIVGTLNRIAGVSVFTAGTAGLAVVTHSEELVILAPVILLAAVILEAANTLAPGTQRLYRRPDFRDMVAARDGTLQAIGLSVTLLGLLFIVPTEARLAVTVAVMSASALTDPLLVAIGRTYRYLARRATSWRRARQTILIATCLTLGGYAVGAAVLARLIAGLTISGVTGLELRSAAIATAAASLFNAGGAIVYRAGRARTAMAMALGTALVITPLDTLAGAGDIAILAVLAMIATVVTVQAAIQPRSW